MDLVPDRALSPPLHDWIEQQPGGASGVREREDGEQKHGLAAPIGIFLPAVDLVVDS
jgi:hypothetical protein